MKIGELAKRTGVSAPTIRYYEEERLLPKASRTAAGYRDFTEDMIRRIGFIRSIQEAGFSLREISDILALDESPENTNERIRSRVENKIDELSRRIDHLVTVREELSSLVGRCRVSTEECCPIIEAFDIPIRTR